MSSYVTACQRSCAEHVELGIVDGQPASRERSVLCIV